MTTNSPTICFATMCKNEEACIEATLKAVTMLADSIVVYDTGSTDRTCEIVEAFFADRARWGKDRDVLVRAPWEGFAKSKSKMMLAARGKADYILHLDADDVVEAFDPFDILARGKMDAYTATLTRGTSSWRATVLYRGDWTWRFCGVAHTIIRAQEADGLTTQGSLPGCRICAEPVGKRAEDPEKYIKDAWLLQQQFLDTIAADPDGLHARSAFYCAQSYFDTHRYDQAKIWYERFLGVGTWTEEIFEAHLRIARCIRAPGPGVTGDWYAHIRSAAAMFPDRAEPFYLLGIWRAQDGDAEAARDANRMAAEKDLEAVKQKYILFIDESAYTKRAATEVRRELPAAHGSPKPRVVVVDDFLSVPDSTRLAALAMQFVESPEYHRGRRTQVVGREGWIRAAFERLLDRKITKWDYPVNGCFQICKAGEQLVYHGDNQMFAGAIYLTPDAPLDSGLSLFRCKKTGARALTDSPAPMFGRGHYDRSQFEEVDRIGNVYNRLVLWDAKLIHAASSYFGDKDENARLFQMFFFDVE